MHKKSQTEILGLAIVVVLILVATIFVVRFLVLKAPADYRKGFVSSELASNMLSTFLKTDAEECSQLTMTELLQDCVQTEGTITCDNGENSCSFVNSTAKYVFKNTLEKWKINYEFSAYKDAKTFIRLGKPCKSEKRSKSFPIPTSIGTMYAKLDICG